MAETVRRSRQASQGEANAFLDAVREAVARLCAEHAVTLKESACGSTVRQMECTKARATYEFVMHPKVKD